MWLSKQYPEVSFVRYADDVVIHCKSKEKAEEVLEAIRRRLKEVKLEIKESKTRIAYCKDYRRRKEEENVQYEFLGYSFEPRKREDRNKKESYIAFTGEISQSSQKKIRDTIEETIM